eukprot:gene18888-38016_t
MVMDEPDEWSLLGCRAASGNDRNVVGNGHAAFGVKTQKHEIQRAFRENVGAPFRLTTTLFSIAGIASATVAANPTPTPTADVVRNTINRFVRVQTIVRRITAANVASCPAKRSDFGFTSVSPNPDASAEVRAAWTAGLGLGDGSTVVAVYGSGPAEAAGLRVGDNFVSVDGVQWSLEPERRKAFAEALDGRSGEKHLMVRRASADVMIKMTPQEICTADV